MRRAMTMNRVGGYLLVLVLCLPACGDKETPLTIPPFSRPPATIRIDDVLPLEVYLNHASNTEETVEVMVEQAFASSVSLDRTRIVYQPGETMKTVEITGRADSGGQFVMIVFTIVAPDGAGDKEIYQVKVEP